MCIILLKKNPINFKQVKNTQCIGDVVWIIAWESSWDNISVHHNAVNLALIHAQPFKYLATTAEHERGAKSDDRPENRRLDNLPSNIKWTKERGFHRENALWTEALHARRACSNARLFRAWIARWFPSQLRKSLCEQSNLFPARRDNGLCDYV